MGWLGNFIASLIRTLCGGFLELCSDCPRIDIFAGHVRLVDFALGPSALALVKGPLRLQEVKAAELEIFLPWYPSRVKMEVVCKGLRVVLQPAAAGPQCAAPSPPRPEGSTASARSDDATTSWLGAYLRQWMPGYTGVHAVDATVSIIDVFREHSVTMTVPSLTCDLEGLAKQLQRLEIKGVFVQQSDTGGFTNDIVKPFDVEVQLNGSQSDSATGPDRGPNIAVTIGDLLVNVVDDKLPHLIGLLDDMRCANAWSRATATHKQASPSSTTTSNTAAAATAVPAAPAGNSAAEDPWSDALSRSPSQESLGAQSSGSADAAIWELVLSCGSVGVAVDCGCQAPFQLCLLDNTIVVHKWPTIVSADCRVMQLVCGPRNPTEQHQTADAPWLALIASIEEECDVLQLGNDDAGPAPVSHTRKMLTIEMKLSETELSMSTGCLACLLRNVPLLANAFRSSNQCVQMLERQSVSWHLGKLSVDIPKVDLHLQASHQSLANAHVRIGPVVMLSHLQQVQGRLGAVSLAVQTPGGEAQEVLLLQEILLAAHEVGTPVSSLRAAQSLVQLVAERSEWEVKHWRELVSRFHRWEVLFSVVAVRAHLQPETAVALCQLTSHCTQAHAPAATSLPLEPIRSVPLLLGGQVLAVMLAVNSCQASFWHGGDFVKVTVPSFDLQYMHSPWSRLLDVKSRPIQLSMGTSGQPERVLLSVDVREVTHAVYMKHLHYGRTFRCGTMGVGLSASFVHIGMRALKLVGGYDHAAHVVGLVRAVEAMHAAMAAPTHKPTAAAELCEAAAPKPPSSRYKVLPVEFDAEYVEITLETAARPAFFLSAKDVESCLVRKAGSLVCSGQLADLLLLDLTDPQSNFNATVSSTSSPHNTCSSQQTSNTVWWRYCDDRTQADDSPELEPDPILEVDARALRIIYLNTTVLTLVALIKDEILPAFSVPNSTPSQPAASPPSSAKVQKRQPRIRAVITQSELHIPSSSYGADALVLHFRRLAGWRQLPHWSTEYARNEQQSYWDCACDISEPTAGSHGGPPQRYCFAPFKLQTMHALEGHVSSTKEYFALDLSGASIGSWCSDNAIATDIAAQCKLEVAQVPREAYETIYGETFSALGFRAAPAAKRARTTVAVLIDPAELVLTQGQYNVIWQMLIGNFAEPPKSLGRVPCQPSFTRFAYINQHPRRSDPTAFAALFADVPVHITSAKILTLDDPVEYEALMTRDLDNTYAAVAVAGSGSGSGDDEPLQYRSVPRWSRHAQLLSVHPSPLASPGVSEGNLLAFASNLVLHFFKKHDGCGTSFDVWAKEIYLVDPSMLPTELTLEQLELEMVPAGAHVLWHTGSRSASKQNGEFVPSAKGQILYRQQSVGPFRRILIDIAHSAVNARLDLINHTIRFFTDPVFARFDREQELFQHELGMRIESPTNLDLEVNSRQVVVCFPEELVYEPRAMCLCADIQYTQLHRGFYRSGPGMLKYQLSLQCHSVSLGLLGKVEPRNCISLSDPFAVAASIMHTIIPGTRYATEYKHRWAPYLHFDDPRLREPGELNKETCFKVSDIALACGRLAAVDTESTLEMRLSYPDILLIRRATGTLMALLRVEQPTRDNYYRRSLQDFREVKRLPRGYKSTVHAPLICPASVPTETNLLFECTDLNLVLRNNLVGFPVLRACVFRPKLTMKQWSEGLQLAGDLEAEAWQFNNAAYAWEPLVEPVKMAVVAATEVTDAGPHVHTELWASAININVFERLLVNPALRKLAFDVITTDSASLPPYTIRNDLGQEITVVVSGRGLVLKRTSLEANDSLALEYKTLMADHAATCQPSHRRSHRHTLAIECELHGEWYCSAPELSMDRPGRYHVLLHHVRPHSRNLKGSLPLLWKKSTVSHFEPVLVVVNIVAGENGSKTINIVSPLSVRNTTRQDVAVKFRRAGVESICEQTLAPEAVFHVPLELVAADAQLFVARPRSNRWGEVLQTLSAVVGSSQPVICACTSGADEDVSGLAWHVRVHSDVEPLNVFRGSDRHRTATKLGASPSGTSSVRSEQQPQPHNHNHHDHHPGGDHRSTSKILSSGFHSLQSKLPVVTLRLSPPIVLTSLLPQPALYRISDATSKVNGAGVVEVGETVHVHRMDLQHKLYLAVRVLNYCWSPWLKISSPNHPLSYSSKPSQLLLEPMNLEIGTTDHNSPNISLPPLGLFLSASDSELFITCPLWIDNRSGLSLEYKSGATARIDPLDDLFVVPHNCSGNVVDWLQEHYCRMSDRPAAICRPRLQASEREIVSSSLSLTQRTGATQQQSTGVPTAVCPVEVRLPCNHCAGVELMMAPEDTLGDLLELLITNGQLPESPISRNMQFRVPSHRNLHATSSNLGADLKGRVPVDAAPVQQQNALPGNVDLGMGFQDTSFVHPSTPIERLDTRLVFLYHPLESRIHDQLQVARESATIERGFFSSTMSYVAPFVPFEGAIPFYPPTLFGTPPSVAVRMRGTTWSTAVDIQSETLTAGLGRHVTLQDLREFKDTSGTVLRCRRELGVHVHKGGGTLDKVTIMTLVPRFILMCNLPQPTQVAQVGMLGGPYVSLQPGELAPLHWPHVDQPRMICIRLVDAQPGQPAWQWSSECKLTNLGDSYVKMRSTDPSHPAMIVKVHIEMAGASLIATLSEEDRHWPPYRIDNFTPFTLRYRQTGGGDRAFEAWDTLAPRTSTAYAWDSPETGSKVLRVQFPQSNSVIERDFKLDELGKLRRIRLMRQLPVLDNPDAEGYLELRNTRFEDWMPYYCVLKHNALFMFKDHHSLQLMGVLNVTTAGEADTLGSAAQPRQFATVHQVATARSERAEPNTGASNGGLLAKGAQAVLRHSRGKPLATAEVRRICVRLALQLQRLACFSDGQSIAIQYAHLQAPLHQRMLPVNALLANLQMWKATKATILSALLEAELCEDMHQALSVFHQLKSNGIVAPIHVGRHSMHDDEMNALMDSSSAALTDAVSGTSVETGHDQHELVYRFQVPAMDADVDESLSGAFQLSISGSDYLFRCQPQRLREWVLGLRGSIESSYLPSSQDAGVAASQLTMEALTTKTVITARLRADGPTKVLELTEEMRTAGTEVGDETETELEMTEADDSNQEVMQTGAEISRSFSIRVEAVGVSLINSAPQELLYLSCRNVEVDVEHDKGRRTFRATVQQVQVDNQLPLGLLAVVLRPKVSAMLEAKHQELALPGLSLSVGSIVPSIHLYGVQRTDISEGQRLLYFKACTLWVIPIEIRLEEELLALVLRMHESLKRSRVLYLLGLERSAGGDDLTAGNEDANQIKADQAAILSEVLVAYQRYIQREGSRNVRMYFGSLHLRPLELGLTFKPSPDFEAQAAEEHLLSLAAQLNDARLCLNALVVDHAYGSASYIADVVTKHYLVSFLRQLHHLIGSFDFLGSSVGLVANLGTGVRDFFYEPIEGLRNDRFLEGLGKGGKSLASHAVGGTMNAASKLAGTVGHGISWLSLDSDYQRERMRNRLREAQCMTDGLKFGARELGQGLYAGVTGVIMAPYRGWKEEGGVGIGKGIVKGIVGVAVKPTVGILDFASRATQGVRNFSRMDLDASDESYFDPRSRVRPPRVFGLNGALIPYDFDAALAQTILDVLARTRQSRMRLLTFLRITDKSASSSSTAAGGWAMPAPEAEIWALVGTENVLLVRLDGDIENGMWSVHVLWACPLSEVQRVGTDLKGDIYLKLATAIDLHNTTLTVPVSVTTIADTRYQDRYTFERLLEQTIGLLPDERVPIVPDQESTLVRGKLWKKHVSGIRAILASSSEFLFFLSNRILYEYTRVADFTDPAAMLATCETLQYQNEVYVMSYAFPLANVFIRGPYEDELGRPCVDIACHANASMLVAKRKSNEQRLRISSKGTVILIFPDAERASGWADLLRYECTPAVRPPTTSQVLHKLWIPSHSCNAAESAAMVDSLAMVFPAATTTTTTANLPLDGTTSTSSVQGV